MTKNKTFAEMVVTVINATPKSVYQMANELGIRYGDGRAAVADAVFKMVDNGQAARQWDEDGTPLYTIIE